MVRGPRSCTYRQGWITKMPTHKRMEAGPEIAAVGGGRKERVREGSGHGTGGRRWPEMSGSTGVQAHQHRSGLQADGERSGKRYINTK